MGNFEDRKIFYKDTCLHCKHCYPFEVFWECESARTEELFCMLGVSDDDLDYLCELGTFTSEEDKSPKLLEIMKMDEEDDLCDSRRIVGAANCCQFFEHE